MPNNVIELVVQTKDGASGPIETIRKAVEGLSESAFGLKEIFASALAGFSAHELVASITEAQVATLALDRRFSAFGDTVGISKEDMEGFAETIAKTTTITDEGAKAAQAALLGFTSITGQSFREARQEAIDLAAALGTDAKTAAEELGRALESPSQGLRTLRQLGVVLSPQQRELIRNFEETGRSAQAQGFILEQIRQRTQGLAEAMANTLGGALTNLKNQFAQAFQGQGANIEATTRAVKDLAKEIGDPQFQGAIQSVVAALSNMARLLAKDFATNIESIGKVFGFLKGIGGPASTGFPQLDALLKKQADIQSQPITPLPGESNDSFTKRISAYRQQLFTLQIQIDQFRKNNPTVEELEQRTIGPADQIINSILNQPLKGDLLKDILTVNRTATQTGLKNFSDQLDADTQSAKDQAVQIAQHFEDALAASRALYATNQVDPVTKIRLGTSDEEAKSKYSDFLKDNLGEVQVSAKKIKDLYGEVGIEGKALSDSLESNFASFFENMQDGWKGFLLAGVDAIKKIFAEALAHDLVKALGLPGSGQGSSGSAVGGLFSAISTAIFGHAGGGYDDRPFLAGENGPELIIPGAGGDSVMNQRQLAFAGSSGDGFNYAPVHNVTIVSDQSAKTQQALLDYYQQQSAKDKAEFIRLLGRNGIKIR